MNSGAVCDIFNFAKYLKNHVPVIYLEENTTLENITAVLNVVKNTLFRYTCFRLCTIDVYPLLIQVVTLSLGEMVYENINTFGDS